MFNQLHILIIDDSEDDAILMVRALEKDGLKLTYERVENAAQLETALDARAGDLVLSDYSLPGFDGADALRLCQKKSSMPRLSSSRGESAKNWPWK